MTPKKESKRPMSRKKKIHFAALASLVIVVLLIEVFFRVFDLTSIGFDRWQLTLDHEKEARVIAHPYLSFMLKPGFKSKKMPITHNSLGYRGPEITLKKPANTFRIACIGGSSTYGHGPSTQEKTWPAQLEAKLERYYPGLRIQVINCGTSGYSTFENMINLPLRIVDLEPDLVILYQSINDMHCGVKPGKYMRDNRHWRAVFHIPKKTGLERVLEHSMTFLVYRWVFTDYMTMGDLAATTIVNFDSGYMPDQWHEEELECFRRNLRAMIAVAREFGAEVLLSTQACFEEHLKLESERRSMRLHAKILHELARDYETYFVDNASWDLMPQQKELYTRDVHLTDKGADRLSENFARYIVEKRIIN
jgi:lysophospholipase L1-like esterase